MNEASTSTRVVEQHELTPPTQSLLAPPRPNTHEQTLNETGALTRRNFGAEDQPDLVNPTLGYGLVNNDRAHGGTFERSDTLLSQPHPQAMNAGALGGINRA